MVWHWVSKTYTIVYCLQLDPLAHRHYVSKTYTIVYYVKLSGILCTTIVYSKGYNRHYFIQYCVATACIILIALEVSSIVTIA